MNPYRPGTLDYLAWEQVRAGRQPDMATAIRNLTDARVALPRDTGDNPPIDQPNAPPRPSAAPTPMPQGPERPSAPPRPGAASQGPRTYDAKGHASDGSQSVGLDNPWKIGAFEGGTYDHATLAELASIADGKKQGSITPGEAAYILRTVGFVPDGQPDFERRWAEGRKLDRYAQTAEAGGVSPWWHDPANAPDEETRRKYGGAYASEQEARDNYGWWNQEGGTPRRRQAAPERPSAPPPPSALPNDEPPRFEGEQSAFGPPEGTPTGFVGWDDNGDGVVDRPSRAWASAPARLGALPAGDPEMSDQYVGEIPQGMRDWWTSRR